MREDTVRDPLTGREIPRSQAHAQVTAAYKFITLAYAVLQAFGIDYQKLPDFEQAVSDCLTQRITVLDYYELMTERLAHAVDQAEALRDVPPAGTA